MVQKKPAGLQWVFTAGISFPDKNQHHPWLSAERHALLLKPRGAVWGRSIFSPIPLLLGCRGQTRTPRSESTTLAQGDAGRPLPEKQIPGSPFSGSAQGSAAALRFVPSSLYLISLKKRCWTKSRHPRAPCLPWALQWVCVLPTLSRYEQHTCNSPWRWIETE